METTEPDQPDMDAEEWYQELKNIVDAQNEYNRKQITKVVEEEGAQVAMVFQLAAIYERLGSLFQLLGKQAARQ